MIDTSTIYMGLKLKNPLVVSPSPLCEEVDNIRKMEDAGGAAVVLHSLFEEQIELETQDLDHWLSHGTESYPEALDYFPEMGTYNSGPDLYLESVRRSKEAVQIPIIASLNGVSPGGWIKYAKCIQEAGADALELNIYDIPVNPDLGAEELEERYAELVRMVSSVIHIPVAVKLHPHFTAMANMARKLNQAGARSLVLFNRFYQPDFDLETLKVVPRLQLSTPQELLLRLHWVAILYGQIQADMAITGGIHSATDVLKAMMAGARVAMMTSALLKNGIDHISHVLAGILHWMNEHEYESIQQLQGSMSRMSSGEPATFERANYMRILSSYTLGQ